MEGRRCDRCKENKHNRQNGCVDCPDCYNLVQSAVDDHRQRLAELEDTLRKINSSPTVINDSDFDKELKNVQNRVRALLNIAKQESGSNYSFIITVIFLDTLYIRLNVDTFIIFIQIYYLNVDMLRNVNFRDHDFILFYYYR